jgi:hypothetical protein
MEPLGRFLRFPSLFILLAWPISLLIHHFEQIFHFLYGLRSYSMVLVKESRPLPMVVFMVIESDYQSDKPPLDLEGYFLHLIHFIAPVPIFLLEFRHIGLVILRIWPTKAH